LTNYVLDTNICIYYLKGLYNLDDKINEVGEENCFLSEITVAELKFGVENSSKPRKNRSVLKDFLSGFNVLPIYSCLDIYAKEKVRLGKSGAIIDDFDLLIGASAIANILVLVTNNEKHFTRMKGIKIENWIH
jgi:tRNA(fMet)-specific endonuclease VapC